MIRGLASVAVVLVLVSAGLPARAQAPDGLGDDLSPREQTVEGLQQFMRGLQRMLERFPTYGMPEVTPEGDIVIPRLDRRRPPEPGPRPPWVPPEDSLRI